MKPAEIIMSDTLTERVIVYKAPFFKKCREDDYCGNGRWGRPLTTLG